MVVSTRSIDLNRPQSLRRITAPFRHIGYESEHESGARSCPSTCEHGDWRIGKVLNFLKVEGGNKIQQLIISKINHQSQGIVHLRMARIHSGQCV
jgi:hypothetical protein